MKGRSGTGSPLLAATLALLATTLAPLVMGCGGGSTDGNIPSGSSPPVDQGGPPFLLTRLDVEARNPVQVTAPAGDDRLFVVEQAGRVRVLRDGAEPDEPFLDISERISSGGERGLLSLAFHPDFATNGAFFLDFTDPGGDTRVERWTVGPDPDRADPASARVILAIEQPYANHNGGHLLFGPDGMLYVALGDGGSGGDPLGSGQDRGTLLGTILRLDVDAAEPYAIPADNPFVGHATFRPEIWAWGLRNPWRIAFDPDEGLLYVADVGQNRIEEIDVVPAGEPGLNFGWNLMEGSECFTPGCDPSGLVLPVVEYDHSQGCSVTGGLVYRGTRVQAIRGHYFYSDYCEGWLRSFRYEDGAAVDHRVWEVGSAGNVVSFGTDADGELYVVSRSGDLPARPGALSLTGGGEACLSSLRSALPSGPSASPSCRMWPGWTRTAGRRSRPPSSGPSPTGRRPSAGRWPCSSASSTCSPGSGTAGRSPRLPLGRRVALLTGLQDAVWPLLRRGIWGLRTLAFLGYYTRPAAAASIGYRADPGGWEARR
jgi:glucose/arabinose dehydrogenase